MKRALFALTLLTCITAEAQNLDPAAPLKAYAAKILPRCLGGVLTVEPAPANSPGPKNFNTYIATLRSDDEYCGAQKYILHSLRSGQIIIGSVIPLPADNRAATVRINEQAGKLLKTTVAASINPFALPDGIKTVNINKSTEYGPFAYQGFLDASEQYLMVGFRGNLNTDPQKSLREMLGAASGAKRGTLTGKTEIVELSDFQCPTCARAHNLIEPIIQKNIGKLSYTRIDLPLFEHHQWSIPAAMGARALQKVAPKAYWEYVDYIFKNQEAIGKRKFDEVFKEFIEDHDLDAAAIQKIYGSKAERTALLDQVSRAFAAGINSTPTFIVNGQIMGFGPEGSYTIDAIRTALGMPPGPKPAPAKKKTGK